VASVSKVQLDHKVLWVLPVLLEFPEPRVLLDQLVHPALMVQLDHKAPSVLVVKQELRVQLDQPVQLEAMEQMDYLVLREQMDYLVLREQMDYLVLREQMDYLAELAHKVIAVPKVSRVAMALSKVIQNKPSVNFSTQI
jgi:hypothetical protein